jgi:hypothetical protein
VDHNLDDNDCEDDTDFEIVELAQLVCHEVADAILDTIEENFEPGYGGVVEFKNLLNQLRARYGGRAK